MTEKHWAYKTSTGDEIVYAADIERMKRTMKGQWKSPTYYSTHEVGRRLPMFQRSSPNKNGPGLFYYSSEDRARADALGEGETLSHALCKRAISELGAMNLKFGDQIIPITVVKSSVETDIIVGDRSFRPDVAVQFTSDSHWELKWDGRIFIEVWHTHAVDHDKAAAFFENGLALFEIKITDALMFKTAEHLATKTDQDAHVARLKKIFENFVGGKILSDPKSRNYLLQELVFWQKKLAEAKTKIENLEAETNSVNSSLVATQKSVETLKVTVAEKAVTINSQSEKIKSLTVENENLREHRSILGWILGTTLIFVLLGIFIIKRQYL